MKILNRYTSEVIKDTGDANLRDADLCGANLRGADLCGAVGLPYCPKIENLDQKILDAINGGGKLEMDTWHKCDTTHCRAGWAIMLAGEVGKVLESVYGPATPGGFIYRTATGKTPNFYADNEEALADIKACAAKG